MANTDSASPNPDLDAHEHIARPPAAAELLACEARYRMLLEHAQVGILLADSRSYYLDANASACQMLGYSREELIGMHATQIVQTTEIPHIETALTELTDHTTHRREWSFRRKDGTIFTADVIASLMPDGKVLALVHDNSPVKQAHTRGEYLAAIVESSSDAIIGKNLNGIVTSWNSGAEAIFGYSADEMIGTPITRLIPEDRLNEEALILGHIRRGERVELLETQRRTRDGRMIEVAISVSPRRWRGGAGPPSTNARRCP